MIQCPNQYYVNSTCYCLLGKFPCDCFNCDCKDKIIYETKTNNNYD